MITYNRLRKNVTDGMQDVRVKTYTVMGFTFFTVLVLAAFAIRPVVFNLTQEIGLLGLLKQQDTKLQTDVANLSQAELTYNNGVVGKTDILDIALPDAPETGPLFANVQAIAQAHNVQITSTRFIQNSQEALSLHIPEGFVPQYQGLLPLYFSMSGTCSPNDLSDFLKDLEGFPRTFNIVDIAISSNTDNKGKILSTSFSLTGFVFYAQKGL